MPEASRRMKLLHLDSSALGDNSVSRRLSAAVVEQCSTLFRDPDGNLVNFFTPVRAAAGA